MHRPCPLYLHVTSLFVRPQEGGTKEMHRPTVRKTHSTTALPSTQMLGGGCWQEGQRCGEDNPSALLPVTKMLVVGRRGQLRRRQPTLPLSSFFYPLSSNPRCARRTLAPPSSRRRCWEGAAAEKTTPSATDLQRLALRGGRRVDEHRRAALGTLKAGTRGITAAA